MLASTLLGTAIKSALKNTVSRTRPKVLLDDGFYDVRVGGPQEGDWHSFPSGHTVDAVAAAAAFIRVFPAQRLPATAVASAFSLVQIPAARHYPLDVAAGTAVGLLSEAVVNQGTKWLKRQLASR
jgi:membrane-associated phospholipid phosphatase